MDARQLRYFLAIVDHGGFGRAAQALFVSQPSLSQAIAALERELGVALFHRTGRRATLNAAGEQLVGHARVVLRDLDAARAAMDAVRGLRSGRVDICTMPSPGLEPLTSMLAVFTRVHPRVSVNVEAAFTVDQVADAVRTGRSEVGLIGAATGTPPVGTRTTVVQEQPLVLVVNPEDDTFPPGDVVAPDQLGGRRLVVSQRGSLMRSVVDDIVAGGVDVHVVVEVAHRSSILPLVLGGVGHAVLPAAWERLAGQVGLRTLRITGAPSLHISVLTRPDHVTPAAQAFLDVARASARGLHP